MVDLLDIQALVKERKMLINSDGEPEDFCDEEDKARVAEINELEKALGCDLEDADGPFICESDFKQYIMDETIERESLGDSSILSHINWQGVADDAEADYLSVDFDGKTWFYPA